MRPVGSDSFSNSINLSISPAADGSLIATNLSA